MWTAGRLWRVLMAVAAIAALAALFGPADRWLGVDIGATGASVFVLAMAAAITWLATKPGEVFPEDWSLSERRGWVGLLVTALILLTFGKFLWLLSHVDPVPERIGELPGRNLISLLVVLGIAWGVCARVLARGAGPVGEDERDLRMRYGADQAGDLALALAVVNGVVLLVVMPRELLAWWLEPLVLANLLVGLLIFRNFVEHVVLVARYALARR